MTLVSLFNKSFFNSSSCSDNSVVDRTSNDDLAGVGTSSTPTSSKLLQLYQRRNQQLRATEAVPGSIAKGFSAEILREIYGSPRQDVPNRPATEKFDSETPVITMQIPRATGNTLAMWSLSIAF